MRALRACGLALALLGASLAATAAAAQQKLQLPEAPRAAILTLDQEGLFNGTRYGKASIAAYEAESEALKAENRRIDSALEVEERSLTDRRASMKPEDFRPLAEAFDKKVEELRKAQEAKSRDLLRKRDEARQRFFQTVAPILGNYMVERGAFAIVDKAAIVVSLGAIDITDEVIARIDQVLGDGSAAPVPDAPAATTPTAQPPAPAQTPAPAP